MRFHICADGRVSFFLDSFWLCGDHLQTNWICHTLVCIGINNLSYTLPCIDIGCNNLIVCSNSSSCLLKFTPFLSQQELLLDNIEALFSKKKRLKRIYTSFTIGVRNNFQCRLKLQVRSAQPFEYIILFKITCIISSSDFITFRC